MRKLKFNILQNLRILQKRILHPLYLKIIYYEFDIIFGIFIPIKLNNY